MPAEAVFPLVVILRRDLKLGKKRLAQGTGRGIELSGLKAPALFCCPLVTGILWAPSFENLRIKPQKEPLKLGFWLLKNCPCTQSHQTMAKNFTNMRGVSPALKALFFFSKPYHSWESKLNEPTNGWIRPCLPKKTSFEGVIVKNPAFNRGSA